MDSCSCFHVHVFSFFFSFFHVFFAFWDKYYCLSLFITLFTGSTTTLFRKKILKMSLTVLFTHLKIILLQYFQFSVSVTISSIQTDPISNYLFIFIHSIKILFLIHLLHLIQLLKLKVEISKFQSQFLNKEY